MAITILVEHSWDRKSTAYMLLDIISVYLSKNGDESSANCAPLVNPSGAGKSRMVDELSKRVITGPMCLRRPDSNGSVVCLNSFISIRLRVANIAGFITICVAGGFTGSDRRCQ